MKAMLKIPVTVIVAALVLGLSGGVQAGGDGRHYGGHGNYGKYSYKHDNRHYAPRRHHRRYNSDDDEKLLVGLLIGGLVGYAISNSAPPRSYRYDSHPPASAPPPADYPPRAAYPTPQPVYGGDSHSCLQEREYQTKVIIGGRQVDAYGTACLQPDGSWRRGPAQAAAY